MSADRPGHLKFEGERELADWYARALAEGSISIPFIEAAREGTDQRLVLELSDGRKFGAFARVLEARALETPPTMRVLVQADEDLRLLLEQFSQRRREGRLKGTASGRRQNPRYETYLQVRFPSYRQLSAEYVSNISKDGMFIRTTHCPPVGTTALLTVTLPDHQPHDIEVKVVRHVTREEAMATGQAPGMGVVFTNAEPAFARAVEGLIGEYRARPPSVLVVDDDLFFLELLGDVLRQAGMQVTCANSGYRAMRALLDCFFELDVIVLDLQMPGLDGYQLIERLRRLRGVLDLRIFVLSSADESTLKGVVGPHGADVAIRKGTQAEEIVAAVQKALLSPPLTTSR